MIKNITEIDKRKYFTCECEKCTKSYEKVEREKRLEEPSNINYISNTEQTFCDDCVKKFKEWMKDKGYLKTDCWCNHIEEYKNGN